MGSKLHYTVYPVRNNALLEFLTGFTGRDLSEDIFGGSSIGKKFEME